MEVWLRFLSSLISNVASEIKLVMLDLAAVLIKIESTLATVLIPCFLCPAKQSGAKVKSLIRLDFKKLHNFFLLKKSENVTKEAELSINFSQTILKG